MYLPPHFAETDPDEIAGLIRDFPLACVVANTAEGLVANHLPLILLDGALIGHVAAGNDMATLIAPGQEVLAVFRGEDAYISPNLYPSKAAHHRAVPTWNYQVVHVHGTLAFDSADKARRAAVGRLTRDQEERANGQQAWRMADAPADFMATMVAGIVAFRMTITRVVAKSKLSQNRDAADHAAVTTDMQAQRRHRLAARMARRAAGD